ncbi:MAG TPA: alkaline phosphatase D family protein [Enhygromyxa sp.]|nr:alkaline phosphatase D family protein [Enhygromyxa sp.]
MTITRRELLRRAGLLGAASLIPTFSACAREPGEEGGDTGETGDTEDIGETGDSGDGLPEYEWDGEVGPETLFSHSVASGDPLVDSVILWTRVSPAVEEPVELFFEVAIDPDFAMRVAADWIPATDTSRDYTVKIDVDGLEAGTTYYYRFYAQGRISPIGRTRTAPSGAVEHLRFAVTSCSSLAHGYFHAYGEIAGRSDLDAVIHLGDYIYEFEDNVYGNIRQYDPPHECVTLDDYRRRYRQYRSDRDLQAIHRQHPFIVTWDDHEICNDGWVGGAANHAESDDGEWTPRRMAGTQAYFEWLPLREGEPGRVYRELSYGDLVHMLVLDTRFEGRAQQVPLTDPELFEKIYAEDRQLLGAEQEAWMLERLSSSTARWKFLAQQVMVGQLVLQAGQDGAPNRPFFTDSWDGYEAARRRLLGYIRDNAIANVVVLTGDVHSSLAMEVTEDPLLGYDPGTGDGSVAVEFVTPGITSPGLSFDDATMAVLEPVNPHWRWTEMLRKGYTTVDVTPERVHVDFWLFSGAQIGSPDFTGSEHWAAWQVHDGAPLLIEADAPAAEKPDAPALAP